MQLQWRITGSRVATIRRLNCVSGVLAAALPPDPSQLLRLPGAGAPAEPPPPLSSLAAYPPACRPLLSDSDEEKSFREPAPAPAPAPEPRAAPPQPFRPGAGTFPGAGSSRAV